MPFKRARAKARIVLLVLTPGQLIMINPVIHYSNTWLPSRRSKLRKRTEVYGVLVRIRESESKLSMTFRVIALLPVGTFDTCFNLLRGFSPGT